MAAKANSSKRIIVPAAVPTAVVDVAVADLDGPVMASDVSDSEPVTLAHTLSGPGSFPVSFSLCIKVLLLWFPLERIACFVLDACSIAFGENAVKLQMPVACISTYVFECSTYFVCDHVSLCLTLQARKKKEDSKKAGSSKRLSSDRKRDEETRKRATELLDSMKPPKHLVGASHFTIHPAASYVFYSYSAQLGVFA